MVGVHRNTAASYYIRLRKLIAEEMEKASPFTGEIEVDESYFGGVRKGRRDLYNTNLGDVNEFILA